MRVIQAVRQRVTAHRFFWAAIVVACVVLGLTLFGVLFWKWSERMAILLAVIEGLTLFFAVFAGYVAAQAYAAAQAKPELDLVLENSEKEITLEADERGRLDQRLHIYIVNRGDAACGYFTVELHFPIELIVQEGNFSSGFLRAEDWLRPWRDNNQLCRTAINKGAIIPEKQRGMGAPSESLCTIDLFRLEHPLVKDECHNIGWSISVRRWG